MRITIHKQHGVTIEDVGDTPVDIFMHDNRAVSININLDDDDGDDGEDEEPELDPGPCCWVGVLSGRN